MDQSFSSAETASSLQVGVSRQIPQEGAANDLDFISLVKGFSRIFWGLALTAVLLLSQTRIEFLAVVRLPAFFIGTALHFWGVATLWRAGRVSPRWRGRILMAGILVLMEVYFFPFVLWWRSMPYVLYFTFNVGVLVLSAIFSLFLCNMIAADLFRRLSFKGECLEAQIYGVAVVFFMALPLLVAIVFSMISSLRYETVFYDELIGAIYRVPVWLCIIVMIPFSLTLAVLWKARDRSYQQFCLMKKTPLERKE